MARDLLPMRIGIVAGESSGDFLGHRLIAALKAHFPHLEFEGIAGPRMQGEGAVSLYPMEKLAVRGYLEAVRHLAGIWRIRRALAAHFVRRPPALFIGIDAPDFNLGLARMLRRRGIPTVQYVGPSVWAWRPGRIRKVRRAVDKVLVIFPFEAPIYEKAGIPVAYVGHPLADLLPLHPDRVQARRDLGISAAGPIIAVLPGSRLSELHALANIFVLAMRRLAERHPTARFLVPLVTHETRVLFESALWRNGGGELPVKLLFGHAHAAMLVADVVLAASGTATLEAALLKRPLVIAYRVPFITAALMKRQAIQCFVGLPNILVGREVVPELLQENCNPEALADAVSAWLTQPERVAALETEFTRIHEALRQDTGARIVEALAPMLGQARGKGR